MRADRRKSSDERDVGTGLGFAHTYRTRYIWKTSPYLWSYGMVTSLRKILLTAAAVVVMTVSVGAQTVELPPVYLSQDHLAVIYRSDVSVAKADSFARAMGLIEYRATEDQYIPDPLNMHVYTLNRSILPLHLTVQDMAHRLRMRWPHIVYMAQPLDHEFSIPSPDELMVRYDNNVPWSRVVYLLEQVGLTVERRGSNIAFARVNRDEVGSLPTAAMLADRLRAEHGDVFLYAEPNTYFYAQQLIDASVVAPSTDAAIRVLPNPFNPNTAIHYDVTESGDVSLIVYNAFGQRVRTLVSGEQTSGVHRVTWDGLDDSGQRVGSGVYVVRLKTEKQTAVERLSITY